MVRGEATATRLGTLVDRYLLSCRGVIGGMGIYNRGVGSKNWSKGCLWTIIGGYSWSKGTGL